MPSWIGDEDDFHLTHDEADSALSTAFYQEAAQNLPSIASSKDSDSDDEDNEKILFSSTNKSDDTQTGDAQFAHISSRQSPTKLQYSWQPEAPAQAHTNTPMSGMSRQHMPAAASLANQHGVSQPSSEADTAAAGLLGAEAGDASMASSTAGWFTGAAGQLAASKTGISSTSELSSMLGDTYAGNRLETEEEVELAFQQAVQISSVPEAVSPGVQLATAIHDTEIDRLLQKLVSGEVEYNPHDPNSGLPPASSLFTDSEASSEAEEDKAGALGPVSAQRLSRCSESMLQNSKCPLQHQQANSNTATDTQASVSEELQHHSHRQQPKVSDEQTKSHTKPYAGTYIHHRQSSRIANRFHRRDDYDAENSVAEEFDDWRTSRSKLKNRSLH